MKPDFLNYLFNRIVKKQHKDSYAIKALRSHSVTELLQKLMLPTGEVSAIAIAREILDRYSHFSREEKLAFFQTLESSYNADVKAVRAAFFAYDKNASSQNLSALFKAVEPPRQELLRRLNRAPNATFELVCMRADLLVLLREHPELKAIDNDFSHLLSSWFNRGFLVMESIDWSTSASILEKIIRYEAVHEIKDWNELRSRIEPENRRCFAFFHPAIVNEPLIFVEVALTKGIPSKISDILHQQPPQCIKADTATFYSISNCQPGLKEVSFGNFLIKQVVQELRSTLPNLAQFVTLSPMPGFYRWLKNNNHSNLINDVIGIFDKIQNDINLQIRSKKIIDGINQNLAKLAANYLLHAKNKGTKYPADPVGRFHLWNGAKLHRINTYADLSENGRRQSLGVMVNYLYDLNLIETNHENYAANGTISYSDFIKKLAGSRK